MTRGIARRLAVPFLIAALTGCQTVTDVGTTIGMATGTIDAGQAEAIQRSAAAFGKALEQMTPEQEYYLGRAVAATVLGRYTPLNNPEVDRYLNRVGQTLAQASERPATFGGYHFLALDDDSINAFAAPGGLVLVTRGMLALCSDENDLAAVLAHEIAHVQHQHGLRSIDKSRWARLGSVLASEGLKQFGGRDLAQLTELFEGSIDDISQTLTNRGYARALERQADRSAVLILRRVGYDPQALVRVLQTMEGELVAGRKDFAATHPPPASRVSDLGKLVGSAPRVRLSPVAQRRFEQAAAGL